MEATQKHNKKIFLLGIVLLLIYVSGLIFPTSMWGVNHLAFAPLPLQLLVLALVVYFCFIYPKSKEKPLHLTLFKPFTWLDDWKIMAVIAVLMGVVFYAFPIFSDFYGDAAYLYPKTLTQINELPAGVTSDLISFNFFDP